MKETIPGGMVKAVTHWAGTQSSGHDTKTKLIDSCRVRGEQQNQSA